MKFLLTGLPRTRTAWFTALLNAHGFVTKHDRIGREPLGDYGRCDPCAACIYPNEALTHYYDSPIVVIERNPMHSFSAYMKWSGVPIDWRLVEDNYNWFVTHAKSAVMVKFNDLNDYDVVNGLVLHLTHKPLSIDLFETFNLLEIDQHKDKAKAAWAKSV